MHLLPLCFHGSGDRAQLTWVLCTGSYEAAILVSAGCIVIRRLGWGRVHFQVHLSCWQNLFPSCVLPDRRPWLLAGQQQEATFFSGRPEFLGTAAVLVAAHTFLPHGLFHYGLLIHQTIRESESASKIKSFFFFFLR